MKNYIRTLLIFLITTSGVFAQINFEKGYFITENGQKTDCYIKNEGWENNPSKFEYRLSPDGDTKVLRLPNLKTVVIGTILKFEKHTVPFDDSERNLAKLKFERSPDYKDTELMLNVLVEGKASLYSYRDGDKRGFYFTKDGGDIQTLIYNVYTNANRDILYNKRYQQQLLTELPCTGITEKRLVRIDYQASDLKSLFKDYNECKGGESIEYKKAKKGKLHVKVFAGAYNSSSVSDLGISAFFAGGVETEAAWAPTFGVEVEYVLPFNRNKWAVFLAPNYSSYEGEGDFFDLAIRRKYKLEYSAIQIPVGVRHYMFLNDNSKLFLSGAVLFDYILDAEGSGNVMIEKERFSAGAGFSLGLGYTYDKYSIEARYLPSRDLLQNSGGSRVELDQFSITIGYTIF